MGSVSLHAVRNVFGRIAEARKKAAIEELDAAPPANARGLRQAHDDLLFLRAFPGDPETARIAAAALQRFDRWIGRLPKSEIRKLDDTGMTGTTTRHVFELPMADWLAHRSEDQVEIDWRRMDDPSTLDAFIRAFTRKSEMDAFDSGDWSTRDWIRLARGADAANARGARGPVAARGASRPLADARRDRPGRGGGSRASCSRRRGRR